MIRSEYADPIEILLVEDNPGDVRLTFEVLKDAKVHNVLNTVENGLDALAYLRKQGRFSRASRPDLILLDLNLPGMNGREVLEEIKKDEKLRQIPVVILTASEAETDILQSYDLHANCFITKPIDFNQFVHVVKVIENFWLQIVKLPPHREQ